MCGMISWDRQPSNLIFWLFVQTQRSSPFSHIMWMPNQADANK